MRPRIEGADRGDVKCISGSVYLVHRIRCERVRHLEDVAPDGTVKVVTEGRLKSSLRKNTIEPWEMPPGVLWNRAYAEDVQLLHPGEPARLQFDMMPTYYLFLPGHRMQVTITGSDRPGTCPGHCHAAENQRLLGQFTSIIASSPDYRRVIAGFGAGSEMATLRILARLVRKF
jgi:predicted acyl esterase